MIDIIMPGIAETDNNNDNTNDVSHHHHHHTRRQRLSPLLLINQSRALWGVEPLQYSKSLQTYAALHAQYMADNQCISHSFTRSELCELLNSHIVGENVQFGKSIEEIHWKFLRNTDDNDCSMKENLRNPYFNEVGIGITLGNDGNIYMCQLFRQVRRNDDNDS